MLDQTDSAWAQREIVKRFLAGDPPDRAPPIVKGPVFKGELSKVYYAETTSCPFPLAVKLCYTRNTGLPDPISASEQFAALQALAALMPRDGPYAAPWPYKLDADSGLLAIEWVNGHTMTHYLKDFRTPVTQVKVVLKRAGAGLRHFHATGYGAHATLDATKQHRLFASNLSSSALRWDRVFMRACGLVERMADGIANQVFAVAVLHGDFKTDNLLLCGDRVVGLDIHAKDKGLVLWDIVPFLNRLGLFFYSPSGWHIMRHRRAIEQRFLTGYFTRELTSREAATIAWLRLLILLQQWDARHLATVNNRLKRAANDWIYRREANWLVSELLQPTVPPSSAAPP